MNPDPSPPPSNDPSLPPRHRPALGNLAKDTTELDLWAFEDDLESGEDSVKTAPVPTPRSPGADIPAPRERQAPKSRQPTAPLENGRPAGSERIQMNVTKSLQRNQPSAPPTGLLKPESEFDDLEHWDDVPKGPEIEELPPPPPQEPVEIPKPEAVSTAEEESGPAQAEATEAPQETEDDEFSPVNHGNAAPVWLRPHLRLSKAERIGLVSLLVLLLAGGIFALVVSSKNLPTETERAAAKDFPIAGSKVTVDSAVSYWRAPITDGPSPETFRRGTRLLPVLDLKISKGSGAVRVLFRNEERTVVGDAVTRAIHGPGNVVIAATAGFDDLGMHAAYRTGGSKPWIIEVYEAASENAAGRDFQKLFEMNISTDRR